MTDYLLDTNVLSEMRKPAERQDRRFRSVIGALTAENMFVSAISIAEIRLGIELLDDREKRHVLQHWLEGQVRPTFANKILQADESTWLLMMHTLKAANAMRQSYQVPDLAIAALARQHSMTVVTRDSRPFEQAACRCSIPFSEKYHGSSQYFFTLKPFSNVLRRPLSVVSSRSV